MTIVGGTGALLDAIASAAPFDVRLAIARRRDRRTRRARGGQHPRRPRVCGARGGRRGAAERTRARSSSRPTLPEDKRRAIALGQASRGIKVMIRARGEPSMQNAIRPGHPFGYLDTEELFDDGTQLLIGFGPDAESCDVSELAAVQRDAGHDPARATRRSRRPRTTGSPTSSRAARGRSTGPAGTSTTTRRCGGPRARCCSPARTSPTAGPGSSTARLSRACAPADRARLRAEFVQQSGPLRARPPAASSSGRPIWSANRYGSSISSTPSPSRSRSPLLALSQPAGVLGERGVDAAPRPSFDRVRFSASASTVTSSSSKRAG